MDPMHQFLVQPLIPLTLGGYDISLTNSSLMMVIATVLLILLFALGVNTRAEVPGRTQVVLEAVYSFVEDILVSIVGPQAMAFFPYLLSLFLFITMGNLLGLVPYSFTFTSQLVVTFGLAIAVFILVTITGFIKHGTHYFRLFLPEGVPLYVAPLLVPIEIISYCARPLMLAVRLFANMVAGHTMMKIFAGFVVVMASGSFFPLAPFPFALTLVLTVFEVFVCLLQAYVFTILSCIYLNDAINLH